MDGTMPVGLRFSILHRSFMKQLDTLLQTEGLTGVQFGVLGQLCKLEEGGTREVNQRDLETATRVTHPTMTEIVKRLEKQGFVDCAPSARDRRYKSIRSTPKAAALHGRMAALDGDIFARLCRGLTEEEIAALLSITDKMLANACCGKKGRDPDRDQDPC